LSALEEVRKAWVRRGVVGHCPVCHHTEWQDQGEVALTTNNGAAIPLSVVALACGNCSTVILVKPAEH